MTVTSASGGGSASASGGGSGGGSGETSFFGSLDQLDAAIKKLENAAELAQLRLEVTQTETRLNTEEEAPFAARDADETHAQLRALEKAFAMKVRRDGATPGKLFVRIAFPGEQPVPALKLVLDVNGADLKVDVCDPPVFLLDNLVQETNLKTSEGARAAFMATLRDKHKLYRTIS